MSAGSLQKNMSNSIYMHICIYVCICVYVFVCVYVHMCVYIYAANIFTHTYIHTCILWPPVDGSRSPNWRKSLLITAYSGGQLVVTLSQFSVLIKFSETVRTNWCEPAESHHWVSLIFRTHTLLLFMYVPNFSWELLSKS